MKFEFDHKTGTMQPRKNEEIYFAQSQGGGLIVDDKKHNIKYIIERNETITKLFGSFDKDKLNLYDMRDARIISDRVVRLLGRDHKYSDFHYFLKGYVMKENVIKSCTDFIGESVWGDLRKRSSGDVVRREDGQLIGVLEDGTRLILSSTAFGDGTLVEFENGNILEFGTKLYVAIVSDGKTDYYYALDGGKDLEDGDGNMTKCFEVDSTLRTEYDFKPLKAFIQDVDNNDTEWDDDTFFDLEISMRGDWIVFEPSRWEKYRLFFDRDKAIEYAIDRESKNIGAMDITPEKIEEWRELFGNDFFDKNWFKEWFEESNETYYDNLNEDDAIEELIVWGVIEDSEDYFGLDEDGEIDHTQPLFDYSDYKEKYVEKRMDKVDPVEKYISQIGVDGLEDHTDFDEIAKLLVNHYGPENTIAEYDYVEREETIDGTTYYIYREK